jgi:ribulose-bisphosphate carboxylase large chain
MADGLPRDRFRVVYRIAGDERQALAVARDICVEQTVEFPSELLTAGRVREEIVGRIEAVEPCDASHARVTISYAAETSGFELTQLLNVVFGNYSMKPGVRVEWLDLPDALLGRFAGPRFGRAGLRSWLGAPVRALLCTALKPMGLSASELADLAYQMALGGIDVIKDDHGLANQPSAPFEERVSRCVAAVDRANRETGFRCIYAPNVAAGPDAALQRAQFAKRAGAGALLFSPGLAGFGLLAQLAADDAITLPILSHPTFLGSFVTSPDSGIAHAALFGQINRLAGADASIFPNFGGRFPFDRDACLAIAAATAAPLGGIKPSFPTPGGGMSLNRVPELLDAYGRDVILLIGGGLHQTGSTLVENCRKFRHQVV